MLNSILREREETLISYKQDSIIGKIKDNLNICICQTSFKLFLILDLEARVYNINRLELLTTLTYVYG